MNITLIHTKAELHALLDSLTRGQTITGTWKHGEYRTTITGPVELEDTHVFCGRTIRFLSFNGLNGDINPKLTSFEATVMQTTTVTRDDPDALLALIESLTTGQKITVERRSKDGECVTTATGPFIGPCSVPRNRYQLLPDLYSVTTTVTKTIRWEREA